MSNRQLTRDLLLEYDKTIIPPRPRAAGLGIVYPWEKINLSILQKQIYQLALKNGYVGNEIDFWNNFSNKNIIFGTIETFPTYGNEETLYFDKNTESLYYFKRSTTLNENVSAIMGVAIVNRAIIDTTGTEEYCLYIPLKAYFIEDAILNINSGSSTEIIN